MAEYRQLTDEQLAEVCRSGELPQGVSLSDVAHDFIRLRRAVRLDSRRAEQLRKLRWALEGTTRIIEERVGFIDARAKEAIDGELEVQAAEAAVVERIAEWVEKEGGMPADATLARFIREGRWK